MKLVVIYVSEVCAWYLLTVGMGRNQKNLINKFVIFFFSLLANLGKNCDVQTKGNFI